MSRAAVVAVVSALVLAGKVSGDAPLTALTLDSVPGPVTAHLIVTVDLSGKA